MFDWLISIDINVFLWINSIFVHPFLDYVMPWIRNKYIWAPLYLFVFSFLIFNYKGKGVIIILMGLFTILISDQLSSTILKPLFDRARPCQFSELDEYIRLLIPCGSGLSFPSSHATNHFALAGLFGFFFWFESRFVLLIGLIWAFLISYAQIYVGVHYPLDILAGAMLGTGIGIFTAYLCKFWIQLAEKNRLI